MPVLFEYVVATAVGTACVIVAFGLIFLAGYLTFKLGYFVAGRFGVRKDVAEDIAFGARVLKKVVVAFASFISAVVIVYIGMLAMTHITNWLLTP